MSKYYNFDKEKAVEMYKEGASASMIGRCLGVNYQSVIRYLKSIGVYESKQKPRKSKSSNNKSQLRKVGTISNSDNGNISREDKIAYCDRKYGSGNWYFMSREECMEKFLFEMGLKD